MRGRRKLVRPTFILGSVLAAGTLAGAVLVGCGASPVPVPVPARSAAPSAPASRQTTTPTPAPVLRVVGLGDSVMAGTNCGCQPIPARLAQELSHRNGQPVEATNLGVAGYTTQDVLDQLHHDASARRAVANADVVVLIIGANDLNGAFSTWKSNDCDRSCYQPQVDAMRARLDALLGVVHSLQAGRSPTILVDNYWNVFTDGDVARASGGEQQIDWSTEVTAAANVAIADAARGSGDRSVDLVQPFKHGGDDDPTPLLADDGDHPNKAGVEAIVAANLAAIAR